ncbi:MAG: peptide-methionine (R)-S-oxide reductase [Nitrospirales bacterium]|nr:MAG: peptide-methionine (R)-S-oxide reductase [Nitrospirales bacterium]
MDINRRNLLKVGTIVILGSITKATGFSFAGVKDSTDSYSIMKSEEEWKSILTPMQYRVLREEATEPPFSNAFHDSKAKGVYECAGCQLPLFSSDTKFDSKTGWPSFWQPVSDTAVETETDWKLLYPRTEVHCRRCGGHLGHIFEDGPEPTGLRYCINSAALNFVPA